MNADGDRLLARVRTALDERFLLVVVALIALALLGGWATYGAVADESQASEQRTVDAWSTTGDFEYGATVRTENEVFDVGERLEDRPLYYTDVAPVLDGEFTYAYDAPDGDADVGIEVVRVVRAVDGEGGEYWSTAESLATVDEANVGPGEEISVAFDVDVRAMHNETGRIERSLGGSEGTTETVVLARVTMNGSIGGEPVERADEYELAVDADDSTYAVDGPEDSEYVEQRTESVPAADADTSSAAFGPLTVLLGAIGALGVISAAKYRGVLAPDRSALDRRSAERDRERFADWISRGALPEAVRDRPRISVASLEELVDVAIDCDRRVIEDEGEYYVVDGEVLYHYELASTTTDSDPLASNANAEKTDDRE